MSKTKNVNVLVVRGGHPYETPAFENMCESLKGVNVNMVLTAHFQSKKAKDIAEEYDAILFLNQNKHYPEYASKKKQLIELTKMGVGMVFMHFTLSSYPNWDEYHDIVGGKWYFKSHTKDKSLHSTYFMNLEVDIKVADKEHPVTKGLKNFTLTDVFYGNITTSEDIHPLLISNHPDVAKSIAWTHHYKQSKIVYIMPGYSRKAYENPSYKKLVANALKYVGSLE